MLEKNRLLIVVLLVLCSMNVNAQNDSIKHRHRFKSQPFERSLRDTFSFTQLRNDPANASNLTFLLDPFYFELYGLNSNLGYAASLRYRWKNTLAIKLAYRGSYYESVEKESIGQTGSFGGPATGVSNLQSLDLNCDYYFNSKIDTNVESVNIGIFRGFAFNERVNALFQSQYGVRLGLQYFQTFVSGNQIPFSGYFENDPSKRVINFGLEQLGTMMEENVINIGLSMTGRHDLLITNQTLGQSKVMNETYLYGDILFAPAMAYANVILSNYQYISREQYTDFVVNNNITKSRFGVRVGFEYTDLSKAGLTFGIETGFRPGPTFDTGLYVMGKFGVSLNAKI